MKSCPITYKIVDQNVIRIVASTISTLGVIFIIHPNFTILALMFYDFFVRALGYEKISPLYIVAKVTSKLFGIKKDKVDAGPKEFALKIGFLFVALGVVLFLLDLIFASVLVIAILTLCALLEAIFNYCIGCEVYMFLKKFKLL